VQEKLNIAQAEAEAAKLADGLKAAVGASKEADSKVKRARIAGRPKRRKSTLTPEELENLMCIN
jgi:hypothetical protein